MRFSQVRPGMFLVTGQQKIFRLSDQVRSPAGKMYRDDDNKFMYFRWWKGQMDVVAEGGDPDVPVFLTCEEAKRYRHNQCGW